MPMTAVFVWLEGAPSAAAAFHQVAFCLYAGVEDVKPTNEQLRALHKLIAKVSEDTEGLRFNTAIAAMMEFLNQTKKWSNRPRAALEPFVLLLAPYAPHIAEECWQLCGHNKSLTYARWPEVNLELLVDDEVQLPVQVNGKMRGTIIVPVDVDESSAVSKAKELQAVLRQLEGKEVKKVIFVKGKIVNIIAK
jgi:leucyl-tRNA synthetase